MYSPYAAITTAAYTVSAADTISTANSVFGGTLPADGEARRRWMGRLGKEPARHVWPAGTNEAN